MSGAGVVCRCGHGKRDHSNAREDDFGCNVTECYDSGRCSGWNPQDGPASRDGALSEAEREWLDEALWGGRIYDDVPAAVERILYARLAASREAEQAVERVRAEAAYHAMWSFFLRLPGPSPTSDLVQREALRLRATLDPERAGRGEGGA